ncbi:hypothetical protein DFJ73DRAFT_46631 [Zopfochytrium polystomum]|nr:hypothetical protein DFJ73DRAFT_46631 [Zopfochytrium polystomum]
MVPPPPLPPQSPDTVDNSAVLPLPHRHYHHHHHHQHSHFHHASASLRQPAAHSSNRHGRAVALRRAGISSSSLSGLAASLVEPVGTSSSQGGTTNAARPAAVPAAAPGPGSGGQSASHLTLPMTEIPSAGVVDCPSNPETSTASNSPTSPSSSTPASSAYRFPTSKETPHLPINADPCHYEPSTSPNLFSSLERPDSLLHDQVAPTKPAIKPILRRGSCPSIGSPESKTSSSFNRTKSHPELRRALSFNTSKLERVVLFSSLDSPAQVASWPQTEFFVGSSDEENDLPDTAPAAEPFCRVKLHPFRIVSRTPASTSYMSLGAALAVDSIRMENSGLVVITLLIRNLAFEKHVHVRFTLDDWKHPYCEVEATYAGSVSATMGGIVGIDRFVAKIDIEEHGGLVFGRCDPKSEIVLQFAVRAAMAGYVFWDNNGSANHKVALRRSRAVRPIFQAPASSFSTGTESSVTPPQSPVPLNHPGHAASAEAMALASAAVMAAEAARIARDFEEDRLSKIRRAAASAAVLALCHSGSPNGSYKALPKSSGPDEQDSTSDSSDEEADDSVTEYKSESAIAVEPTSISPATAPQESPRWLKASDASASQDSSISATAVQSDAIAGISLGPSRSLSFSGFLSSRASPALSRSRSCPGSPALHSSLLPPMKSGRCALDHGLSSYGGMDFPRPGVIRSSYFGKDATGFAGTLIQSVALQTPGLQELQRARSARTAVNGLDRKAGAPNNASTARRPSLPTWPSVAGLDSGDRINSGGVASVSSQAANGPIVGISSLPKSPNVARGGEKASVCEEEGPTDDANGGENAHRKVALLAQYMARGTSNRDDAGWMSISQQSPPPVSTGGRAREV